MISNRSTRDSLVPSVCIMRYISAIIKRFENKFGRSPIDLLQFDLAHGGFNLPHAECQQAADDMIDHLYKRELRIANGQEDTSVLDLASAVQPDESLFAGAMKASTAV